MSYDRQAPAQRPAGPESDRASVLRSSNDRTNVLGNDAFTPSKDLHAKRSAPVTVTRDRAASSDTALQVAAADVVQNPQAHAPKPGSHEEQVTKKAAVQAKSIGGSLAPNAKIVEQGINTAIRAAERSSDADEQVVAQRAKAAQQSTAPDAASQLTNALGAERIGKAIAAVQQERGKLQARMQGF